MSKKIKLTPAQEKILQDFVTEGAVGDDWMEVLPGEERSIRALVGHGLLVVDECGNDIRLTPAGKRWLFGEADADPEIGDQALKDLLPFLDDGLSPLASARIKAIATQFLREVNDIMAADRGGALTDTFPGDDAKKAYGQRPRG